LTIAKAAGCDVEFAPSAEEIYPPGDNTRIVVPGITEQFDGKLRLGHFEGVATVVTKLFLIVQPNIAVFGEKDWQQCLVVRRLIQDLHLPIELRICKTLREVDGLAMSSRNVRLTTNQRKIAPVLYNCLQDAANLFKNGKDTNQIKSDARRKLQDEGFEVDYFAIVDSDTLGPPTREESRVIAAASLGAVRLIDNLLI
jgi:pantoate--beta-alanine ligase